MHKRRSAPAFSLVELLVVMAIVLVLVGMLIPTVQKVREAAKKAECTNNLRSIGLGIFGFQGDKKHLPHSTSVPHLAVPNDRKTFYWDLLPYVEQAANDGSMPVPLFFCPSRRGVEIGAYCDYAGVTFNAGSLAVATGWHGFGLRLVLEPEALTWPVPDARIPQHVTSTQISKGDGTSNTIMLSHKGMSPQNYVDVASAPNANFFSLMNPEKWIDRPWGEIGQFADANVLRNRYYLLRDQNRDFRININPSRWRPCDNFISSPHATMPCLFADGSIRFLALTKHPDTIEILENVPPANPEIRIVGDLWSWNDNATTPASAFAD